MSCPSDWRYSKFFDITIARLTEENRLLELQKNLICQQERILLESVENMEKQNNDIINDVKQHMPHHDVPLPVPVPVVIVDDQTIIGTREKLLAERKKRQAMYEQWKANMINTVSKPVTGRSKN